MPTVVRPVPPEVVGSAVAERDIVSAGVDVAVATDAVRNVGTAATEKDVTVPEVAGFAHESVLPFEVKI